MKELIFSIHSPLFDGIAKEDRMSILDCIGYHFGTYRKGQIVAFENENIRHIGIVISGAVDMVKEDVWGNKTLLLRLTRDELFGEAFALGDDPRSTVTFVVSADTKILFISLSRVLRSCANACAFHHRMIENMVGILASKNIELMRKVEVVSKRTTREKLLTYLSHQAQSQNTRYFQIPLGRTELAEYLCVDRSAMTRELAKMKQEGILDFDKNYFRLM